VCHIGSRRRAAPSSSLLRTRLQQRHRAITDSTLFSSVATATLTKHSVGYLSLPCALGAALAKQLGKASLAMFSNGLLQSMLLHRHTGCGLCIDAPGRRQRARELAVRADSGGDTPALAGKPALRPPPKPAPPRSPVGNGAPANGRRPGNRPAQGDRVNSSRDVGRRDRRQGGEQPPVSAPGNRGDAGACLAITAGCRYVALFLPVCTWSSLVKNTVLVAGGERAMQNGRPAQNGAAPPPARQRPPQVLERRPPPVERAEAERPQAERPDARAQPVLEPAQARPAAAPARPGGAPERPVARPSAPAVEERPALEARPGPGEPAAEASEPSVAEPAPTALAAKPAMPVRQPPPQRLGVSTQLRQRPPKDGGAYDRPARQSDGYERRGAPPARSAPAPVVPIREGAPVPSRASLACGPPPIL